MGLRQREGWARPFTLVQAFTVFLALIGTTLACLNTGARVTYAMGRDEEMPARTSACSTTRPSRRTSRSGPSASSRSSSASSTVYSSIGDTTPAPIGSDVHLAKHNHLVYASASSSRRRPTPSFPNTIVIIGLINNFGTFLLYMMTCVDRDDRLPGASLRSMASSTWSSRSSACWRTSPACSSTLSDRSRSPA